MLQNCWKNKIIKPTEIAEKVRQKLGSVYSVTDESVMRLCQDTVFEADMFLDFSTAQRKRLIQLAFSSIRFDLEYLQVSLDDPDITELMVNGPDNVFYEKSGHLYRADYVLDSKEQLRQIIQRLTAKVGREMNDLNPIVDARLSDGSRINAVNDNIAINGPVLTIRKFGRSRICMEDLIQQGDISKDAAVFLSQLVQSRYNIFVSGGTSSGKTTFLNILSDYIPRDERIIVIEDSAELQIRSHENLVRMETKNANSQGKGGVTIRDLIKTSLRMRPDRIIVGEVRGGETIDMLQAMGTGHDGSLSTGHANSPAGMIRRLETMHISASGFPLEAVRAQIADSIEIIIQLKRFYDGHRRVVAISEIIGVQDGEVGLNTLYEYYSEKGLTRTENEFFRNKKYIERFGKNIAD